MERILTVSVLVFALLLGGCLGDGSTKEPAAVRPQAAEEAPKTSLPAPDEGETVAVEPVEEPSPPEIGYYEAVRQIVRLYPHHLQPLSVAGRIPVILHDLDNDRHPECFSLGVPSQGIDRKDVAGLTDSSRLFEEDNEPVAFFLLVFSNIQGNFQRLKILDLGEHVVFDQLSSRTLYRNRSLPVIVTASFQTIEGTEAQLLVFDDGSGLPRARRTLLETLSTQYRLEDIDGNGMIDLFVKEKAMEEGTGFETFLIWYRWNGRDFVEYWSQNVVRNLNAFLAKATELLLAGELRDIVDFLLDSSSVRTLRKKGWSDQKILVHALGLEELGLDEFPALREVVFPPFLEDPFAGEEEGKFFFDVSYRMIDVNGTSYIAEARLYMLANPFRDRQFAFAPLLD
jgi:hypothetical protein